MRYRENPLLILCDSTATTIFRNGSRGAKDQWPIPYTVYQDTVSSIRERNPYSDNYTFTSLPGLRSPFYARLIEAGKSRATKRQLLRGSTLPGKNRTFYKVTVDANRSIAASRENGFQARALAIFTALSSADSSRVYSLARTSKFYRTHHREENDYHKPPFFFLQFLKIYFNPVANEIRMGV